MPFNFFIRSLFTYSLKQNCIKVVRKGLTKIFFGPKQIE